jgi:hypothetical protein
VGKSSERGRDSSLFVVVVVPLYSSGRVSIFRDPHFVHFMCLPTSATGSSGGNGMVAGSTSRSHGDDHHH